MSGASSSEGLLRGLEQKLGLRSPGSGQPGSGSGRSRNSGLPGIERVNSAGSEQHLHRAGKADGKCCRTTNQMRIRLKIIVGQAPRHQTMDPQESITFIHTPIDVQLHRRSDIVQTEG